MFGSSAQLNAKIRRDCDYVRNFYEDEQHHHATVVDEATLKAILTEDKICDIKPDRVEYLDEYDAKRILIPEMKDLVSKNYPDLLQASFWTLLWSMSAREVQNLRDKLINNKEKASVELLGHVGSLPPLIRIFRGQDGDRDPPSSNERKRSRPQANDARIRDKFKCVITDTPKPKACHIFPFAALWGSDRITTLTSKLAGESNTIDTPSNMICLTPTLHDWWTRGYFALEPMGEAELVPSEGIEGTAPTKPSTVLNTPTKSTPTSTVTQNSKKTPTRQSLGRAAKRPKPNEECKQNEECGPNEGCGPNEDWVIRVRFHWLKKTNVEGMTMESFVDFSDDPIGRLQGEGLAKAFNATTCRQVEDGQVFTFRSKIREHLPDYDILLLQWDLLRMWRLAGGADPSIYPFHDEFDDRGIPATITSRVELLEDSPMRVSGPGTDAASNTGEGSETAGFKLGNGGSG
ncbi:hypothetical protein LY76DRAFT_630527 [Colletotrichum caudatum]|nr:hypothetical protein LY76DRAFT_630527 [Colletotrichum caudatum]